jgi:hypothetical protein
MEGLRKGKNLEQGRHTLDECSSLRTHWERPISASDKTWTWNYNFFDVHEGAANRSCAWPAMATKYHPDVAGAVVQTSSIPVC